MRVGLLVVLASSAVAHAAAGVQPTPGAIDFGPVDVHGLPATRTVTLTNTGTVALDIAAPTETGDAAFSVAGVAKHLVVGGSVTATVTYHPTSDVAGAATISFAVASNAPVVVAMQGRGIDRHMSIAAPVVPDTFRNPGDAAPNIAVTVMNTGEANLAIGSASLSGAPVWTLLDDEPVDIPGGTSYDFVVQFAPSAIGPAPPGRLVLASNDTTQPTVTVPLEGNGIARAVSLGPDLDLGYVGIDTTLASEVQIVNLDAVHDFTVASMTTSDPAFALDVPGAVTAGSTTPLRVQFSAAAPGDYTTTVTLFLDPDPEAQDTVTLSAHAVYLDAQGGGGCSAGGGAGGGMMLLIVVLLLRRRLRALALVLVPVAAQADPPRNLDVSIFDPTPATATSGFQLVTSRLGTAGDATVSALLTYAANPLVLASPNTEDVAIANRMTLVLGGAWVVRERLELGAHLPLFLQNGDASDPQTGAGTPAVRGDGAGSLTLHAKAQLVPELAAIAMVMLPTASDDRFAGESRTSGRLLALATLPVVPRLTATLNFGAVLRPEVRFASYTERSAVAWGAGATYRATAAVSVTGELFGELVPGGRRDAMNQGELLATTELLVGVHDRIDPRFSVGLAVGRGVIEGPGAPAFRSIVTVTFAPTHAIRVHAPGSIIGVAPTAFAPPPIATPPSPTTPRLPPAAPLADRDHDGIADVRDACPDMPETINGIADDDGCPDAGSALVTLQPHAIALLAPVTFASGATLAEESHNVLGQIAATLRAHPELGHVRIVAHVQPTANRNDDLQLSRQRAEAVREWLVQWGVAAARLEAKGWGGLHPLVLPDGPDAAATNTRIEIVLVN